MCCKFTIPSLCDSREDAQTIVNRESEPKHFRLTMFNALNLGYRRHRDESHGAGGVYGTGAAIAGNRRVHGGGVGARETARGDQGCGRTGCDEPDSQLDVGQMIHIRSGPTTTSGSRRDYARILHEPS